MRRVLWGGWELLKIAWSESRKRVVISFSLMLLQWAALPLAAPALGRLTDSVVEQNSRGAVVAGLWLAAMLIASLVSGHFSHIFYFELGEMAGLRLQADLIRFSNDSAGLEHHERPEYADKMQVLRQETERMGWTSMQALLDSAGLSLALGITIFLLVRLNPFLLLLPLAAIPPLILGRRAESLLGKTREAAADPTRRARHLFELSNSAASAKELRTCGLGPEIRARHDRAWAKASRTLLRGEMRAVALRACGQLVFALGYVGATLLVVRDAVAGSRSVGDVVLAITLAAQVNQQVTDTVNLLQEMQRTAKALSDLRWIQDLVSQSVEIREDAVMPERIVEGIRVSGLQFAYPGTDRIVLGDVDLFLPAGSTVALVGENGAGKTTLVKLLCRFYDSYEGAIQLDGVDIRRFLLREFRERIAAGFQDFARFEFLARETVGLGDLPEIESSEAVLSALERAEADDVIRRLEDGLETLLGKSYADGTELSGGQWQKLALGRAMMRTAPLLLVLDEPTSALDAQAEHDLFERYAEGAQRVGRLTGAITLLVSHRFSTVRMADLILVVADGKIIEAGNHQQLMALDGLYAELFNIQARAYS